MTTQPLPPHPDVTPSGVECPDCRAFIVPVDDPCIVKLAAFLYGWQTVPPRPSFTTLAPAMRRQWVEVAREALEAIK